MNTYIHQYGRIILTAALSDPEAITDAWESGHGDEDADEVAIWNTDQEKDKETKLKDRRYADERLARHPPSLGVVRQQRWQDAWYAERQHVVPDMLHSKRARHERLHTHTQCIIGLLGSSVRENVCNLSKKRKTHR